MKTFLRNINIVRIKSLIVFGFFSFLFLTGCEKETPVKMINSDILVSSKYKNGKVYIDAVTEKEFQCLNYSIDNSILREKKIITVNFTDVSILGICLTALGPAKAEIDLDELERGDYILKFILDGVNTEAKLSVGSKLTLELIKAGNVKLK